MKSLEARIADKEHQLAARYENAIASWNGTFYAVAYTLDVESGESGVYVGVWDQDRDEVTDVRHYALTLEEIKYVWGKRDH